jgi:hypothetical protein
VARKFPGQRWLRITLRTLHLGTVAMVIGSAAFQGPELDLWLAGLLLSGGLLVVEELYRYGLDWFRWVQAWVILTKLALFAVVALLDTWQLPALWIALVLGAVISHAPGKLRQAPLWGEPGPCASKSAGGSDPTRIGQDPPASEHLDPH